MTTYDSADVEWRVIRRGRVQHAVVRVGAFLRSVCGETGLASDDFWSEDPSRPKCRTCVPRVTPA